jgi:hypothetical protein
MTKISKSPERNTFQRESFLRRRIEEGKSPNHPDVVAMVEYYDQYDKQKEEREENLEWRENNLEYDLRSTDWILEKVRESEAYAQNLYAAMCNRDFQRLDVLPVLKDQRWSCSWRYAGGIIADMREEGDYIDWYCSGMRGDELSQEEFNDLTVDRQEEYLEKQAYVPEGVVTDEIQSDLKKLGWIVLDSDDDY